MSVQFVDELGIHRWIASICCIQTQERNTSISSILSSNLRFGSKNENYFLFLIENFPK